MGNYIFNAKGSNTKNNIHFNYVIAVTKLKYFKIILSNFGLLYVKILFKLLKFQRDATFH
jgi:hypothetical protein